MNRRTFVGLAFVFTLPLAACTASDGPVDPVWGKQPCAHCAMLVTEARYSGQALEKTGARHYFDDLGCLALWMEGKQLAGSWAYEGGSARWLDTETSSFRAGEKTPMDFGFVVVADGGEHRWPAVSEAAQTRMKKR
jgi:hypothetical protein